MLFDFASNYFFSRADGVLPLNQHHDLKISRTSITGLLR